ncbi:putative PMR5 domain, PC-Esterase, trichome birefringence-like family [Helianthus annuus]|uniref:PMR5 domain, PC-Esterase, trichome birefringence-like family n=1 Tax=Helianthus annuus TaxID=4232 RepID=A0A251UMM8_HELAN|nr:protein trichome birefringence [Helianthus annuus]KAF5804366.1 putative PMR5 domain, PC-Esterase, trichome birefringence-like family [Helianthus annuus]KAJ0954703.1 putative PMR5 domain, PC-Esterase, trichome birefringence-like family [Helianthus annuus]
MADSTKYIPINNRTLFPELKLKNIFSFRTTITRAFVYIFVAIFVAVTFFLAFNPSSDPSSPWFTNIFTDTSITTTLKPNGTTTISPSSDDRSHFSSIYSYFFPTNSSESNQNSSVSGSRPLYLDPPNVVQDSPIGSNQSSIGPPVSQIGSNRTAIGSPLSPIGSNQSTIGSPVSQIGSNRTVIGSPVTEIGSNQTAIGAPSSQFGSNQTNKEVPKLETESNNTVKPREELNKPVPTSLVNDTGSGSSQIVEKTKGDNAEKKQGIEYLVKNLVGCDLFDGEWVMDESYPLYEPGSCSLIDEQFNCFNNGRPDLGFQKYKWKPKGCTLPRLDGSKMLNMLRGKRLVFVGDSLNRNMWESLICILRNSVQDKTKVYEASGRHHFRSEASYAFVFKDYNCTVEFFVAPFLVQEWETKDKNGTKKETLRLDLISSYSEQYKTADVIVFNTGHWWTHDKTAKGQDYYQEGSHVYKELNVLEAFRKAITTWGIWVDANINPTKTSVFFRGYSASHFSGGQWNSGGACDHETEPIKNTTYLTPYPDKMVVLEKVFKGMKTGVTYLNVTRLTDFRKDGHPSIYRKQHYTAEEQKSPLHYQDCSHWCLPGVPDAWNEILYAELLVKQYQSQQKM